jgi:anti-sigma B factor antagonist
MKIDRHVEDNGVVWLRLIGELDLETVETLHASIEREIDAHPPKQLIVDLAGTAFCDSTGISALMDARAAATGRGVSFQVMNPSGITRRTMQVTGVLHVLTAVTQAA